MGRKKRCAYWMKPMRMPMVTVPKKPETRAGCRPNAAAAWRKALLCRTDRNGAEEALRVLDEADEDADGDGAEEAGDAGGMQAQRSSGVEEGVVVQDRSEWGGRSAARTG